MVDSRLLRQHRLRNGMQSLLLIAAMAAILATVALVLGGALVALFSLVFLLPLLFFAPRLSPRVVLALYGAAPLAPPQLPDVYERLFWLAERAGVTPPSLYYIASPVMNAFSVGGGDKAAIAVTDGLLRELSLREIQGVLAHEIAHIRHHDIRVMSLADLVSRMTSFMSMAGQLLLLVNLPLMLVEGEGLPWLAIMILIFAPSLTSLLQLALSRRREFDADLGAAELSGDPAGLASALVKLEMPLRSLWGRILLPGRNNPDPSLLRSHPLTEERVARLRALAQEQAAHELEQSLSLSWPVVRRRPRQRLGGFWH